VENGVTPEEAGESVAAEVRRFAPNFAARELPPEYSYASLPICVVDAVFSIGIRYESVRKTVRNFCAAADPAWALQEKDGTERSISELLAFLGSMSPICAACDVFGSRHRTSSQSGILKSDAVVRVAKVLKKHGIERFSDWRAEHTDLDAIKAEVQKIPGQKSGISFDYLAMLAGDEQGVKPDRMIKRFVCRAMGEAPCANPTIDPDFAAGAIRHASGLLRASAPSMNPRLLDYIIWENERGTPTGSSKSSARRFFAKRPKITQ
jgi:hypothetical protein